MEDRTMSNKKVERVDKRTSKQLDRKFKTANKKRAKYRKAEERFQNNRTTSNALKRNKAVSGVVVADEHMFRTASDRQLKLERAKTRSSKK